MKLAIVTTTIYTPRVLDLWNAPDVPVYIAGDLKTPPFVAAERFTGAPFVYLAPEQQKRWKSSELTGWNTDSRRNFAVLEALKDGADIILSIDDDMIPLQQTFLDAVTSLFEQPFSGIQLGASQQWLDHGRFTVPPTAARGIPYDQQLEYAFDFVCAAPVGVVQGIIYGVPDATAVEAIANRPVVMSVVEPLVSGFVAHPEALAVFNSQLTAFRRELAPWFVQHYKSEGRNTDIFAAVAMREKMRELGWYTYYGPPGAWHNRMPRPLFNDLKAEMYGAEHIERRRLLDPAFHAAWLEDIASVM